MSKDEQTDCQKSEKSTPNITVIGDSITEYNFRAGKNWVMYLEERFDQKIQNLGISGTGFVKTSPYLNRLEQVNPDADIIGVAMSFNDLHADYPIGNYQAAAQGSEASITRNAYEFFERLVEKFPHTQIIAYVQNPWENYRLGNEQSDALVKNVAAVCEHFAVPFYTDLYYQESELKPWIKEVQEDLFTSDNEALGNTDIVDNVHPNSKGHKIIADYLADKFSQFF